MCSNTAGYYRIDAIFDKLDTAQRRCAGLPFDTLTVPELLALSERYEFLMGLAAVKYELISPFARDGARKRDA